MGAVKPFHGGPLGVPETQGGGVWEADHSSSLAPSKPRHANLPVVIPHQLIPQTRSPTWPTASQTHRPSLNGDSRKPMLLLFPVEGIFDCSSC